MIRFDAGTPRPHLFASARKLGISFVSATTRDRVCYFVCSNPEAVHGVCVYVDRRGPWL
jgi:hypothetical protein